MCLRKIDLMHKMFGRLEGHICCECSHFMEGQYHNRILRKCSIYGLTSSEASDWAKKYVACGQFNRPYSGKNVINLVKRGKSKPPAHDEGQVKMEV